MIIDIFIFFKTCFVFKRKLSANGDVDKSNAPDNDDKDSYS